MVRLDSCRIDFDRGHVSYQIGDIFTYFNKPFIVLGVIDTLETGIFGKLYKLIYLVDNKVFCSDVHKFFSATLVYRIGNKND